MLSIGQWAHWRARFLPKLMPFLAREIRSHLWSDPWARLLGRGCRPPAAWRRSSRGWPRSWARRRSTRRHWPSGQGSLGPVITLVLCASCKVDLIAP